MLLAATDTANDITLPPVICTLLFIAVLILFVLALLEIFNVRHFLATRYGACIGFVIGLILYVVLC